MKSKLDNFTIMKFINGAFYAAMRDKLAKRYKLRVVGFVRDVSKQFCHLL